MHEIYSNINLERNKKILKKALSLKNKRINIYGDLCIGDKVFYRRSHLSEFNISIILNRWSDGIIIITEKTLSIINVPIQEINDNMLFRRLE